MVSIFLELPDDLLDAIERKAAASGRSAEDLIRHIIETSAPSVERPEKFDDTPLEDEPIVKAAEIEEACRKLGYRYGWRFITCPQANAARAKLLLISLNPAGREVHGPSWSQEDGSAYRIESWGGLAPGTSNLQRQVQQMLALLKLRDEEVVSAHYVPFRSPSWAELDRKAEAETFARSLWRWLAPRLSFDRIVCIGKEKPGKPMANLFGGVFERSMPVGWGNVTADRYRITDGRQFVALPHLSRFAIFGRPEGAQALRELFEL
jgi:hypothetical protein